MHKTPPGGGGGGWEEGLLPAQGLYLKQYMYVEMSDEVFCNTVTANKHTEISI